jgi:hypothetical protein
MKKQHMKHYQKFSAMGQNFKYSIGDGTARQQYLVGFFGLGRDPSTEQFRFSTK